MESIINSSIKLSSISIFCEDSSRIFLKIFNSDQNEQQQFINILNKIESMVLKDQMNVDRIYEFETIEYDRQLFGFIRRFDSIIMATMDLAIANEFILHDILDIQKTVLNSLCDNLSKEGLLSNYDQTVVLTQEMFNNQGMVIETDNVHLFDKCYNSIKEVDAEEHSNKEQPVKSSGVAGLLGRAFSLFK